MADITPDIRWSATEQAAYSHPEDAPDVWARIEMTPRRGASWCEKLPADAVRLVPDDAQAEHAALQIELERLQALVGDNAEEWESSYLQLGSDLDRLAAERDTLRAELERARGVVRVGQRVEYGLIQKLVRARAELERARDREQAVRDVCRDRWSPERNGQRWVDVDDVLAALGPVETPQEENRG